MAVQPQRSFIGVGLAIGVGVGSAIGVAMGNLAVGIAVGAALGIAIGGALDVRDKAKRKGDGDGGSTAVFGDPGGRSKDSDTSDGGDGGGD